METLETLQPTPPAAAAAAASAQALVVGEDGIRVSVPAVVGSEVPAENVPVDDKKNDESVMVVTTTTTTTTTETQVVETEISVMEVVSVQDQGSNGVNGGDAVEGLSSVNEHGAAEIPKSGLSQVMESQVGVGGEALVIGENDKSDVGNVAVVEKEGQKDDGSLQLNGEGDEVKVTKVDVSGDEISLVVEVQGSSAGMLRGIRNEVACEDNSTSRSGAKIGEKNDENRSGVIEDREDDKRVEEGGEAGEEERKEEMGSQDRNFSVGDFVWGKIKNHPWWPGQIYDPSDASSSAEKYQKKDHLLVAYFGDRSFAWCNPSQLKPFQENFEKLSTRSNSDSFLNAVEVALGEIGRRVELETTCYCASAKIRAGLDRPLAVNAGVRDGVAVPEGGCGEFSVTQFEPVKFLEQIRCIARFVSITNMLELTVLRRRLLAFNRTRGYDQLPLYDEPMGTKAPEDSSIDGIARKCDSEKQTGDLTPTTPEPEWLSSPDIGKASNGNYPGFSDDKLYQRKKQRTMAEIMADDVEPEKSDATGEETLDKTTSTSRKRKKNKEPEVGTDGDLAEDGLESGKSDSPSEKGKRTKLLESPSATEENKDISGKSSDTGIREGSKTISLTRERKKSKYLSYPYTSISKETKGVLSWMSSGNEIPKGQHVGDVEDQPTGSPPIVGCSGEFQKKLWKESPGSDLTHQTSKDQKKTILKNTNVSPDEMLSEILSAALNPFYLKENHSYRSVKSFFAVFRSSLYCNGYNYEMFNNYMAGQCEEDRESPDSQPVSPYDCKASNGESKPKKKKKKDETMLQSPESKSEHADGTVQSKQNRKRGKDDATLQSKSEHVDGTVKSKQRRKKRKDEAMLQNPESKSEHEAGVAEANHKKIEIKDVVLSQSPQSKSEVKAGNEISKPTKINEKDKVMVQSPKCKSANEAAGIEESKPKKRKRKDGTVLQSPETKSENEAGTVESEKKRIRGSDETRLQSDKSNSGNAAGIVDMKLNNTEKANGETAGAVLLLTFASGVSLPSKDDLITIFSRFGTLNELETEVLQDSSSAQVVYVRCSDAETAFNNSGKISQFGPNTVTYRLRYLPIASKVSKQGNTPAIQLASGRADSTQLFPAPPPTAGAGEIAANQPASRPPVNEAPPIQFIRQNLQMMTSLLENSGDKLSPEMKAKLEGEIRGLLKKVSTMADSSSS